MPSPAPVTGQTGRAPRPVHHRVRLAGGGHVHAVEWPAARTGADAPTVVLAHGWTLSHASWLPVVERLRATHDVRVVAYDQPGHGGSAPEDRAATVHALGDVLGRVLTAVAPTAPLVLAGHSMGGMTVMAWAADHPDELARRVRGVALVATAARVGTDRHRVPLEGALMRASSRAPRVTPGRLLTVRSQTRMLYGPGTDSQTAAAGIRLVRGTALPAIGRFFAALQEHDEREALAHLSQVPVRVLAGSRDRLTPVRQARELADGIRGSRLSVLPELGHMLTYEAPDVVAATIGDLLSG